MSKQKLKFTGTLDELKDILREHDIRGDMNERPGFHRFETNNGACLHWYENGTICFQGPPLPKAELEEKLEGVFDGSGPHRQMAEEEQVADVAMEDIPNIVFSFPVPQGCSDRLSELLKFAHEHNRHISIHFDGGVVFFHAILPGDKLIKTVHTVVMEGSLMPENLMDTLMSTSTFYGLKT